MQAQNKFDFISHNCYKKAWPQQGDDQTSQTGQSCGGQEKQQGITGDFSCGTNIPDAGNAHNNGAENQREDHHV